VFYTTGNQGSAVPVQVEGVGGTGTLTGVASLTSDAWFASNCAVLTSGGVDCWGDGYYGQLGNGVFYTTGNEGSAVPVQVYGLGGVAAVAGYQSSNCALLTSGGVDCWGDGSYGELGNGVFYTGRQNLGSAFPVNVK
jgi:hypothetical protein